MLALCRSTFSSSSCKLFRGEATYRPHHVQLLSPYVFLVCDLTVSQTSLGVIALKFLKTLVDSFSRANILGFYDNFLTRRLG